TTQHPRDTTQREQWLDKLLSANQVDITTFLSTLTTIMNKRGSRRNAFVREGPATTGKSLMLKLINRNYRYRTVQRSGDHSQFFLMNLLRKSLAFMEGPKITTLPVNDFK
ncbi:uncharacterized protein DEA37_0009682, partial [Paragonimus westermani]